MDSDSLQNVVTPMPKMESPRVIRLSEARYLATIERYACLSGMQDAKIPGTDSTVEPNARSIMMANIRSLLD